MDGADLLKLIGTPITVTHDQLAKWLRESGVDPLPILSSLQTKQQGSDVLNTASSLMV